MIGAEPRTTRTSQPPNRIYDRTGSLKPARTVGSDIVAVEFPFWWVYVVGPVLGAVAGAVLWERLLVHGSKKA